MAATYNTYPPELLYLVRPAESFWEWRDGGQVISWTDGPTITFRAELEQVLRRLEYRGFPPLSAVLLLLAACRESWPELRMTEHPAFLVSGLGRLPISTSDILTELDKIHDLPADLRESASAKAELAAFLFESAPVALAPRSGAGTVLDTLAHGVPEDILSARQPPQTLKELLLELDPLREGLRRLDPETLQQRIRTGLDQMVRPAAMDLAPADRMKRLLAQLDQENEFRGIVRLARDLMAAVHLPRSLGDRDDLPLGGISDITNRGPLDRLLLSELAYDHETLITRVALNEALYIRREAPPKSPPTVRAILIDAGLRTWGVPRAFATAVALSLIAGGGHHTQIVTYRAHGDEVESTDLFTREGLLKHLEVLETAVHPGAALPAFQTAIAAHRGGVEPVLVTVGDVLTDAEFQRSLQELNLPQLYVATVERDGRFSLSARTARGLKSIREAQLQLDDLLEPPRQEGVPLIDSNRDPTLPAIFSASPFPLRLSHSIEPDRTWAVAEYGVFSITNDGRLMLWQTPGQGAVQLAEAIPRGRVLWSTSRPHENTVRAVLNRSGTSPLSLISIDCKTKECTATALECTVRNIRTVCEQGGALMVIGSYKDENEVEVFTPSGRRIRSMRYPGDLVWQNDRFFRSADGRWHALAFDGEGVRFEEVPMTARRKPSDFVWLFEREGHDGIFGFTRQGKVYRCDQVESVWLTKAVMANRELRVLATSRCGNRLICGWNDAESLPRGERQQKLVIDFTRDSFFSDRAHPKLLAEPEISRLVNPRNLRHKFQAIAFHADCKLRLISQTGNEWRLEMDDQFQDRLCLRQTGERKAELDGIRPFEPISGRRYQLRVARWKDGSRAFLDSRGLLHLQSSDPSIPETTLVLQGKEVACWCADGRLWGRPYFTGDEANASAAEIFQDVLLEFVKRLR